MNKLILLLACFVTIAMGQEPRTPSPVTFATASIGHPLVECASLNGPIGPLKDCHLMNGATLDDLANEISKEQQRMRSEYAKMSERYFRCSGVFKEVPATK